MIMIGKVLLLKKKEVFYGIMYLILDSTNNMKFVVINTHTKVCFSLIVYHIWCVLCTRHISKSNGTVVKRHSKCYSIYLDHTLILGHSRSESFRMPQYLAMSFLGLLAYYGKLFLPNLSTTYIIEPFICTTPFIN